MPSRERILIVRLAAIGDVVMASSLARRLRDAKPDAHITWLCGETVAALVECFADVDDVMSVDDRRLLTGGTIDRLRVVLALRSRLRPLRFDAAYLLHPDPRYRIVTSSLRGTGVVIAQSRSNRRRPANPIPGRYLGDEAARLMDGRDNGPIQGHFPLGRLKPFSPTPRVDRPRVVIVPGGAKNVLRESALKRWPVEHYVAVARALVGDGFEVTLVGNAGDDWVRPHFSTVPITNLIGRTSIPETLSLFAGSDLVIAHDTGPMHLARLVGSRLIALFGPTAPTSFVAPDETTTVLWGGEHLACRPCYDGREFADCADNECMSSISADVVIRTARTILRETQHTPARPTSQTLGETALR
jgi:heptosyltransferase-2